MSPIGVPSPAGERPQPVGKNTRTTRCMLAASTSTAQSAMSALARDRRKDVVIAMAETLERRRN
jgi:hypothetical protein